jgi:hypothetical protein
VLFKHTYSLHELLLGGGLGMALKNAAVHNIRVAKKCLRHHPSGGTASSSSVISSSTSSAAALSSAAAGSSSGSLWCKITPWDGGLSDPGERATMVNGVVWGSHSCTKMEMFLGACRTFCPDAVVTVILFFPIFVIVPLSVWKRFGFLIFKQSPIAKCGDAAVCCLYPLVVLSRIAEAEVSLV